jgi:predicted glycoside hydrolase/deacetylase ChbG (UPF0249 family)
MANMPAFAVACAIAQHPLLQGRIGLHFNLTYGRPLSEAILEQPMFCNPSGEFALDLSRHRLWLSRRVRQAVQEELEAQWQRCLEHGLRPCHLDSHEHVHNIWPIGEIVARFAARQGVAVRLARNFGHNIGPGKRLFKTLLNLRLRSLAGATADYVCTPADLRDSSPPTNGLLEVIIHPSMLGTDFGDACLNEGESLTEVLESRLSGVPRVPYNLADNAQTGSAIAWEESLPRMLEDNLPDVPPKP